MKKRKLKVRSIYSQAERVVSDGVRRAFMRVNKYAARIKYVNQERDFEALVDDYTAEVMLNLSEAFEL